MLSDKIKKRLTKDRPMTTITLRIPVDAVDSLKEIAPQKGLTGYQTLIKAYISEGLRRDEAQYLSSNTARLVAALRKHGVSDSVIAQAEQELHAA